MKKIIYSLIYLAVIFSVSQFIFEPTHLYYEITWLDIPMHILGGFGVAALIVSIFSYKNTKIYFWKVIIPFFVVAVLWEIIEYIRSLSGIYIWGGWLDTIKDLFDGFVGVCVYFYLSKK